MPEGFVRGWTKHLTPPVPGWQRTDPLDHGLIGDWRFDSITGLMLPDYSGRGNHGTIHGATWVTERYGPGLYFDGNDYVDLGTAATGIGTGDFAVVIWFQATSGGGWALRALMSFSDNSPTLYAEYGTMNWIAEYSEEGGGVDQEFGPQWHDGEPICAIWYRRAGTFYAIINGVLSPQTFADATTSIDTVTVNIGRRINDNDRHFVGLISGVRLYNRALSLAEGRTLYNAYLKRNRPLTHAWMMPWGKAPDLLAPRHPAVIFQGPAIV